MTHDTDPRAAHVGTTTTGIPLALRGAGYALGSFGLWGLFPLYFKAVASVPAIEVLAHRVAWSMGVVAILLTVLVQWPRVTRTLRDRRARTFLFVSALLIGANWLIFIWAVAHDHVLQASLGYYITPLVSVLFGRAVLGECLHPVQWLAVALAAIGVIWMLLGVGVVPWIALGLAATFGSYGLTRKLIDVEAIAGLFVEVLILSPAALAYLLWLGMNDAGRFTADGAGFAMVLMASGLVTAIPLILFAQAVRRLRLAAVGLFQYLVPTMQMLLAVFAFGETFTREHAVAFGCIWAGLALYSASAWRRPSRAA